MISRFKSLPLAAALLACLAAPGASAFKAPTAAPASTAAAATSATTLATTDRLIVKYRSGVGAFPTLQGRMAAQVAQNRHGVQFNPLRQMASGAQVLRINRRMTHAEMDLLGASLKGGDPNIEYVEPDRVLKPLYVPNDAMYAQQWSLSDTTAGIRAPAAWDKAKGSGVVVAVIDTGVRPHADLAANLLPGYDFIASTGVSVDGSGRDADATDPGDYSPAGACGTGSPASNSSWHGTHVSGIVAAAGGNGVGVTGVAYGARILPLRALGRCGGYSSDIADAITWAAGGTVAGAPANPNPARVINLSLGGGGACGTTTQTAINTARAKGAVVVVAAGNENGNAANSSPANCSGVIVVSATGKTGGKASYSNTGDIVTLAAPGGDSGAGILSTLNAGATTPGADSYASYMGTSMATPVVSGVAALMLSVNPKLTPDQVAILLKSSARAFPAACVKCGAGLVDANAAVAAALAAASGTTPAPVPTPIPTPTPTPTPTPVVTAITELEPNDTVAKAQVIASFPSSVTGSMASNTDLDHYSVTIAGGKKLTATLTAGATSGFGLTLLNTSGQQLLVMPGVAGAQQQVTISNTGGTAVTLVLKVLRSTGAIGAYKLGLAN